MLKSIIETPLNLGNKNIALTKTIKEGINKAKEVINSGFALKQLEKLIHWSDENIDS
mgnify:CR=1 FL=1